MKEMEKGATIANPRIENVVILCRQSRALESLPVGIIGEWEMRNVFGSRGGALWAREVVRVG